MDNKTSVDVGFLLKKINAFTAGASVIRGVYKHFPKIVYAGNLGKQINAVGDTVGITKDDIQWQDDPAIITYDSVSYNTIKTMRKNGELPRVISGCALVICSEDRKIVLHERSRNSATYPGAIHLFGGSLIGRQLCGQHAYECDGRITRTIQREVYEESRLDVAEDRINNCTVSLAEELQTGFVQVTALGLDISKKELRGINTSSAYIDEEGKPWATDFDDIEAILTGGATLVPTGYAHILLWLGLGAAGTPVGTVFSGKPAQELFNDVLRKQSPTFPVATGLS